MSKISDSKNVEEPLSPYLFIERGTQQISYAPVQPVIKWAGGKSQLLSKMDPYFPKDFNNYHEPFVGGGAVAFYLIPKAGKNAWLSDINGELINFYRILRDRPNDLIDGLQQFERQYLNADDVTKRILYYQIRSKDKDLTFKKLSTLERAIRFYILNKTAYNGLYRTNSKGLFNVPWGRYKKPSFIPSALRNGADVLKKFVCCIEIAQFDVILENAKIGDFVYLDPPYMPLSKTSSFTSYSPGGFTLKDQERLLSVCNELHKKNIRFMLSNSDTSVIRDFYKRHRIIELQARRNINSKGGGRGPISELLIINY